MDAPVLRDQNKDGDGDCLDGSDQRLYYLTDANMNVTALLDGTPGSQTLGEAVERYAYDPYGKVTFLEGSTGGQTEWNVRASQSSTVANEVLFAGYRRDNETGLYHVRNRPYHPLLGRWLTRDGLGCPRQPTFSWMLRYLDGRDPPRPAFTSRWRRRADPAGSEVVEASLRQRGFDGGDTPLPANPREVGSAERPSQTT